MRGPERTSTFTTRPSRMVACARTTPLVPSRKACRGISGFTCVGHATPISCRPVGCAAGGGGGAITAGVVGGVCTEVIAGAVTGGVTSGGGMNGGGGASILGVCGLRISFGGGGGGGGMI